MLDLIRQFPDDLWDSSFYIDYQNDEHEELIDNQLEQEYGQNLHNQDVLKGSTLLELKERYNASLKVFERLGKRPRREE